MTCTWNGCDKPGTKPQTGATGQCWATLCAEHAQKLETVVASCDPKAVMSAWISAQGGPAAATQRMQPAIDASARLLGALLRK